MNPPSGVDDPTDERDPVDELAEEFALRLRRGERPSVTEYLERYPGVAEQLRDVLPTVEVLESAKVKRPAATAFEGPIPQRLGDFRIVREVGRGGMGIVYEAEQESLRRRVALKVLPATVQGDPARRARFEREARVAAGLHHTAIVPVFGVGEEGGVPYFVMQYIEGAALDEVIKALRQRHRVADLGLDDTALEARGRSYWRFVARVGLDIAEALAYAHERGALHRDIKPSNILIDRKGAACLVDFGIAKIGGDPELTESGDVIGTTRFLAPEALAGETSPQSDVYGLGVTLYEVATLEPAFSAPHTAALIDRIRRGEAPPPRVRDPRLPRDLETVIQRAIACEPRRRYGSAAELADDLRRFLDDRPVLARRIGPLERLARACRKNPALASLGLTAAASLTLAAVAGWSNYGKERRALIAETRRREEVEAARKVATENVELSLAALEDIFDALAPDSDDAYRLLGPVAAGRPGRQSGGGRRPAPGSGRRARGPAGDADSRPLGPGAGLRGAVPPDLLDSILDFYERFAESNATDVGLRREAARAYGRIADVRRRTGDSAAALAAVRRALEILVDLQRELPPDESLAIELVEMAGRVEVSAEAESTEATGEDPTALVTLMERAVAVGEAAIGTASGPHEQGLLSRARVRLAVVVAATGDVAGAERMLRETIARLESTSSASPRGYIVDRGVAHHALASVLAPANPKQAIAILEESIRSMESAGSAADSNRTTLVLADQWATLAALRDEQGDEDGAHEARERSEALFDWVPARGGPNQRRPDTPARRDR